MFKLAYIFGGGFGLYGYLPALNRLQVDTIQMSSRYRARLTTRADLKGETGRIVFCEFDPSLLQDEEAAVIFAKRPLDQEQFLEDLLEFDQIRATLLLEKPLTPAPQRAMSLIDRLVKKNISFRINYIMKYCEWRSRLGPDESFRIKWQFKAHHFKSDSFIWKRYKDDGGGVLRFYGIHFVNLFFSIYGEAAKHINLQSANASWSRVSFDLVANSGRMLRVEIDSNHDEEMFRIEKLLGSAVLFDSKTPFDRISPLGDECPPHADRRISPLANFIRSSRGPLESKTLEEYRRTEAALMNLEERFEKWTAGEDR